MTAKAKIDFSMSNQDYHAQTSISSSQLKDVLRSPAHFYAKYLAEDREPTPETDNMRLGSAVHLLFLEPELYADSVAILPMCDRRTKDGKLLFAEFEANSHGKIILTQEQNKLAQGMAAQLRSHLFNQIVMQGKGHREASIFYVDEETGLSCRIRPDYHVAPCDDWPNGLIIDLKTTDDARPHAFAKTMANFSYHISAAMYCEGFKAHYNTENYPDFAWLVIERNKPFACAAYSLSENTRSIGYHKMREAFDLILIGHTTEKWPSYPSIVQTIEIPNWVV